MASDYNLMVHFREMKFGSQLQNDLVVQIILWLVNQERPSRLLKQHEQERCGTLPF